MMIRQKHAAVEAEHAEMSRRFQLAASPEEAELQGQLEACKQANELLQLEIQEQLEAAELAKQHMREQEQEQSDLKDQHQVRCT